MAAAAAVREANLFRLQGSRDAESEKSLEHCEIKSSSSREDVNAADDIPQIKALNLK